MAELGSDPERERRAAGRRCGPCSLCCTLLRVDALNKPAGRDCIHQRSGEASGGCGIHDTRPPVCRAYRCLWLQGGLEDDERPDRIGGVVDLETVGVGLRLGIREAQRGRYDASPALQSIAARYREQMPVRITDAEDVLNPDRPFRVLLADGVEQRVEGDRVEIYREGVLVETRRLPWAERIGRRLAGWWRARGLDSGARGSSAPDDSR